MITLLIVRGLPGSGKTTFAKSVTDIVFAADDYFMVDGEYKWDPMKLREAHESCLNNAREAVQRLKTLRRPLSQRERTVAVTNVFAKREHVRDYTHLAFVEGVRRWVIDLFDQGMSDERLAELNLHGVPAWKINQMRLSWEP